MSAFFPTELSAQKKKSKPKTAKSSSRVKKTLYGQASFYGNKFNGRKTASGAIFSQRKLTAACNVLPLGTKVKVTNLKNGKSVVVTVNDRLHVKTKRLIDLTYKAASILGYTKHGLARVRIDVLH
jgi:rare lipoprotein A